MAEASGSVPVPPSSGSWRMLQSSKHGGQAATVDELISTVCELAAQDGSAGWLCAMFNAGAYQVADFPEAVADEVWGVGAAALVVAAAQAHGRLVRSGADWVLTGQWEAVVGSEFADWLMLTAAGEGGYYRVLLPRREARTDPVAAPTGLPTAGICSVSVSELPVFGRRVRSAEVEPSGRIPPAVLTGAVAAVAVAASAGGLWQAHVEQVRERLAASCGSEEATDQAVAAQRVARAASDIDAAKLQVTTSLRATLPDALRAQRQSVSRARDAADLVFGGSRHALDASDAVTRLWQDVHTGCGLTFSLLDGLDGLL